MKRIFICGIVGILLMFAGASWAMEMPKEEKTPVVKGKCPKTQVVGDVGDCMRCHVEGSFAVKETLPDATFAYPNRATKIFQGKNPFGYYVLEDILPDPLKEYLDYLEWKGIKKAVIELYSPGGSLFAAWRIVGIMNMAKAKGMVIETRCHGFAASAGFLIFISGSMGHRAISPQSEVMWHELISFKFIAIDTPSSSEDEAKILRHLQDTANEYIATRCKLSKEELDKRVKNKEFWMNGKEAYRDGFADKLLVAE